MSNIAIEISTAIEKMNAYGKTGVPFFFMIDFEMEKPVVLPLHEMDPSQIRYKFNDIKNYAIHATKEKSKLQFDKLPIPYVTYEKAFHLVVQNLQYGNSFLTNLTFPTKVTCNANLHQLFNKARAKYKLDFNGAFIVFSPETFVKIRDGKIYTYPMKGTINANIPGADQILMNDEKEKAEHFTIVDLLRNDLGIVARDITVTKFRYLEQIKTLDKTLYQTSSEIMGTLPQNYASDLGNIIFAMLPAGSISGAPKKKTVEIIQQAEGQKRGYYTGIMGIFDGQNLDSAVMIRYIEHKEGQLYFRSGCGITALSDCESEYKEMIDKVYVPIG